MQVDFEKLSSLNPKQAVTVGMLIELLGSDDKKAKKQSVKK